MQDTMKRKYTCDRSITVTRLEDLVQDAAVGLVPMCLHQTVNLPNDKMGDDSSLDVTLNCTCVFVAG